MKQILWFVLLLLAAVFGSRLFVASDVAKLQPVEVLRIRQNSGMIQVETDTGETGRGPTLEDAFADLKNGASGDIFLDTVEFVLIPQKEEALAQGLIAYLRPACRICFVRGAVDLEKVAAFLDIHRPTATLMNCRDRIIPLLIADEGRLALVS